jgi:predicted GNAT family acetyltransferase
VQCRRCDLTPLKVVIRHEPVARRFVTVAGDEAAYITYREIDGRILDLHHTFVPRQFRGGGIASQLTAYALEFARAGGYRVIPSCPFVSAYISRHPEFRDLVA